MTPPPEFNQALDSLRSLTAALGDERTTMAIVRDDGDWFVEQDGESRYQSTPLSADVSAALVNAVHRHGPVSCRDHWWVEPVDGGAQATVIFERRPSSNPDGLSRHTLELLRTRLESDANGLIYGTSSRARSNLLVSLTRFLSGELTVYVGPVPPIPSDGPSLVSVAPPGDDADRRRLQTLVERADTVLWDGPMAVADIRLLFGGSRTTRRWLTLDGAHPDDWLASFELSPGLQHAIDTRIGVRRGPDQSTRLRHFSTRDGDRWNVLFDQDDFDGSYDEPGEHTVEATRQIDHNSSTSTDRDTTNPERPTTLHAQSSSAVVDPGSAAASSDDDSHHQVEPDTNPETPAQIRESGEIEVPGFDDSSSGEIDDEDESDSSNNVLHGERIDRDLPELVANGNIDDVDIPELDPRQLRRTFESDVDVEYFRKQRKKALESSNDDASDDPESRTAQQATDLDDDASMTDSDDFDTGTEKSAPGQRVIAVPSTDDPGDDASLRKTSDVGPKTGEDDIDSLETRTDKSPSDGEPETDELGVADSDSTTDRFDPDAELDTAEFDPDEDEPETQQITVDEPVDDPEDEPPSMDKASDKPGLASESDLTERLDIDGVLEELEEESTADDDA